MKKLFLSSVGTSILTNIASKEERSKLYNNSNCIDESDCPDDIKILISNLEIKANKLFETGYNFRRFSAELNGIFGFYENTHHHTEDLHYLITTDTYQGKKCGEIIRNYLVSKNINAQIFTPNELTTRTKYNFEQGIKNLLKWCDETLNGFKNNGYEIIFNLTGSFKSLQGYLNTIAMFYADKIIYIFESEKAELIEIPKLPVEIDNSIITEYKEKILLMAAGYNYPILDVSGMPKTIIDEIEGKVFLSVWGELLWNKTKKDILTGALINLPFLSYSDEFKKLFNSATNDDKVKLQEILSKVAKILLENNGDISKLKQDGGLQYENYSNKKDETGLPIGHFRITQGDRVSCIVKDNKLLLRKFGRHDFVNNNP